MSDVQAIINLAGAIIGAAVIISVPLIGILFCLIDIGGKMRKTEQNKEAR